MRCFIYCSLLELWFLSACFRTPEPRRISTSARLTCICPISYYAYMLLNPSYEALFVPSFFSFSGENDGRTEPSHSLAVRN